MAYGNHHISTQFTGVPQQQQQQQHLPAQGTGYPRYGGSDTNVAQQQQQPPISPNEFYNNLPQHTGFQNYPSYPQNQGRHLIIHIFHNNHQELPQGKTATATNTNLSKSITTI